MKREENDTNLDRPSKKLKMDHDDSGNVSNVNNDSADMFASDTDDTWSGVPMSSLPRLGPSSDLPCQHKVVEPGHDHTVAVELPLFFDSQNIIKPHPRQLKDIWDSHHVRMPWSEENLYPVSEDGRKVLKSRWSLIKEALTSGPIRNSRDLEEAILSYNVRYRGHQDWSFSSLHILFEEEFSEEETENFFNCTLPKLIEILVSSPRVLTCPIPLLTSGRSRSITLSQQQVSVLLVNAFFCCYPRRNATKPGAEYNNYPFINFNTLFGECSRRQDAHLEKLKCFLCYFSRIVNFSPTGLVTFSRKCLDSEKFPFWSQSTKTFSKLHISSEGTIETEGAGMLQADFANKFIGGGVLRSGLVQEEIRFSVCPELIASLLFTEVLDDNEVMIIIGAEQYSNYSGYANSFTFAGRHHDKTPLDVSGRRETSVVAMDAIRFTNFQFQFRENNVERELVKAFVAFSSNDIENCQKLQAVATGNWGCGAFGGDLRLKLLIQMMAAAQCQRDLAYFTFGDKELVNDGGDMYKFLTNHGVTVGQLYKIICSYSRGHRRPSGEELFRYISSKILKTEIKGLMDSSEAYNAETDEKIVDTDDASITESEKLLNNHMDAIEKDIDKSDDKEDDKGNNIDKPEASGVVESYGGSTERKNVGLLEALDQMEKGELGKAPPINVKEAEKEPHSNVQSKVTDFFSKK